MIKNYIFPLILQLITTLSYLYIFEFETNTIPGWNTTISENKYPIFVVIIFNLVINWFIFRELNKKTKKISSLFFIIHFVISASTAFFIRFPSMFLNFEMELKNTEKLLQTLKMLNWIFLFFIIVQIIFAFYIMIKFKKQNERN
jgi:uncharacterized membrane protein